MTCCTLCGSEDVKRKGNKSFWCRHCQNVFYPGQAKLTDINGKEGEGMNAQAIRLNRQMSADIEDNKAVKRPKE